MRLGILGAMMAVIILVVVSCQSDQNIEFKRYYSSGALVYQQHCQNCHGANGEGLSALIPPLTDSAYLKKNKNALACFITSGLKGQININNKTFDNAMPASDLLPIEVGQVLTYIGNSFGNKLNTFNQQAVQANLARCN